MADFGLISIVMPVYNRAHLVGESIQSVLAQTYRNWEMIIVDDGSTDDTLFVVRSFFDARIRILELAHSGVIGKVRNAGLEMAKGDFIGFIDSDDLWVPEKLSFQIALFTQFPQVSFAFSHGMQFGESAIPPPLLEKQFVGNVFRPMLLEERFVFYVPTLIFRKHVLSAVGVINTNFKSGGDIDFFFRMANKFEGIFSDEQLVRIRKHGRSTSTTLEITAYEEYLLMVETFYRQGWLTTKEHTNIFSRHLYKMGLLLMKRKDGLAASKSFLRYCRLMPFDIKGWIRLGQSWFV